MPGTRRSGGGGGAAARALLLVLLLGTGAHAQRAARESRGGAVDQGRLAVLFEEAKDEADLRRRLHALKPDAIPLLFRALDEGRLVALGMKGGDRGERTLDPEELRLVRETLIDQPRRDLVQFLSGLAEAESGPRTRAIAIELLGEVGTSEHFRLLARLALPHERWADRRSVLPFEVRGPFQEALSSILARDPGASRLVRGLFMETPPALSGSIVEALGDERAREGSVILASLLGHAPGLDPLIIARIAERGPSGLRASDESVREAVRPYLGRHEPALIGAAAHACGELQDDESLDELLELTDHPDALVRGNVFRALKRITGFDYGEDVARWSHWYTAEKSWWDRESEEVLRLVELGSGIEFARAAREALEHRLFRDRLAEAFVAGLPRADAEHVILCCQALGRLGSPEAVEELIECLDHRDREVREAAREALRSITGHDLGLESQAWLEATRADALRG